MKAYNGHRSWNAWNVSMWLYNDAWLYSLVQEGIANAVNKYKASFNVRGIGNANIYHAVRHIMRGLPERTPDGAKFNPTAVKLAIEDDFNLAIAAVKRGMQIDASFIPGSMYNPVKKGGKA